MKSSKLIILAITCSFFVGYHSYAQRGLQGRIDLGYGWPSAPGVLENHGPEGEKLIPYSLGAGLNIAAGLNLMLGKHIGLGADLDFILTNTIKWREGGFFEKD